MEGAVVHLPGVIKRHVCVILFYPSVGEASRRRPAIYRRARNSSGSSSSSSYRTGEVVVVVVVLGAGGKCGSNGVSSDRAFSEAPGCGFFPGSALGVEISGALAWC